MLTVRLAWAAAVPLAVGLTGDISLGLTWLIASWLVLSVAAQFILPRPRLLSLATDLVFVTGAVILTGLSESPLWWGMLVAGGMSGLREGLLAALLVPSLSLLAVLGFGAATGTVQAANLAPLGRAMLTVLILTPAVGWIANWLGERLPSRAAEAPPGASEALATSMLGLSAELSAALEVDRIPDIVVDLATKALSADDGQLRTAVLLRQEHGYQLPSDDGEQPALLPGRAGLLRETLRSGSARQVRGAAADPELSRLSLVSGSSAAACVPLMTNGQAHALLLCSHPDSSFFTPPRMALLEAIANQASIALQNAQLLRGLELERDRITETEEETRRKLARDLHDGPTQTIAAIAMRLDFARRLVSRDQRAAEEEIETLERIARQTTREIRHMLFTLRPLVLESKGLVAALHQLAKKLQETHGQSVMVEAEPEAAEGLDLSGQAVIFFIAEEAINNARKHAEAANVWVELRRVEPDRIRLNVRDDGVGFNVGAVDANYEQRGSLGMVSMRERSELVHGSLRIESAEGKGTQITLEVPLTGS